ncbi:MAG: 50S ribosomal protein L30 [Thermoprotei archaeon]|nr:MAG: 50S ribosomal protein L30 [Thermoprotei archaeon]
MGKRLAVIRIRGTVGVRKDIEYTLRLLRLVRKFHAVVIDDRPDYLGMLQKVKDYVTWGEIDAETLAELLRKRGRLVGNRRPTDEDVKKLGYSSIEEFAEAVIEFKAELSDIPGLKPVFRLHPPKGGFKGTIKRMYGDGGETGYRGKDINELLRRMI